VNQVLQKKDVAIENVYFPEDSILSLVISMSDERTVEVATVGQEGVLGLSVLWGADLLPILSIEEVPGKAPQGIDERISRSGRKVPRIKSKARTLYTSPVCARVSRACL